MAINKASLSNSSEWRLAEDHYGLPDLLPTQENDALSDNKDTNSSEKPNTPFRFIGERGARNLDTTVTRMASEGYDGLMYENWYEGLHQMCYVALEPNQIKSATENNGEFDAGNGDIRFSIKGLSQETDAEGHRFYENDNGSINLWDISEALKGAGRQVAPVRLTDHNVQHIIDEHKSEYAKTESDVINFLEDVVGNITQLRKARGTGLFAVVGNRKTNKAAILRLYPNSSEDYYNIETAGYYRDNYWKEGENDILWERSEPNPSTSDVDLTKPQVDKDFGEQPINAVSSKNLESKDTNSSENSNGRRQLNCVKQE